ncbi:MAG: AI-2E family transporter [Burkholderiaceae bacterium]|nr:AI-2E family transporter [Rhodoferax sp.]
MQLPVDVRSASLVVLAILAGVFMLHWARAILVPLLLGLTFSYALSPLVTRLERARVPRGVGAGLVLLALMGALGATAVSLQDDATAFVESLPQAAQKMRQVARAQRSQPETAIDKVQKAATELERAASETSKASAPERGVTRVQIERPRFNVHDYLLEQMPGLLSGLAQATIVLFLTYFLLASGDSFRRKMVTLAGPTFARRKLTVQALDEITDQVQRYLRVQVLISVIVGIATGLAYWAIGVEHAAVWGVLALLLNFIPYLGSIVVTGASALAGFVQFGSVDMGLVLGGTSIALHTVSGHLLTPWLTSRASRINPVAVFVGVLVFGWLWGVWGLLLGTPVLLIVKAVCDRVDDFRPLGALLER